ncbi:MAG: SRPBCC family protein [Thiotrichales bacterium]
MIRAESWILIERPLAVVFRFVAVEFFENYPKWSPEIVSLQKTMPGPIAEGVTAVQVRRDFGYRTTARFRVTRFEVDRSLVFEALTRPWFRVTYQFEPVAKATRLTFQFELAPEPMMLPFRRLIVRAVQSSADAVVRRLQPLLESQGGATIREPGSARPEQSPID